MKYEPIHLHPRNPHCFFYKEQPLFLITAGEHYGAVLNLDFDYIAYLDTLKKYHLNLTRVFSGAYVENENDIAWMLYENTLAPQTKRFLAPWKRSNVSGYPNGGCKFDLDQWDEAYFTRLQTFIRAAAERSIVVEYVFFSQMYGDSQWGISPLHERCNINDVGTCTWDRFTTLEDEALVARQERLVRKVVQELNSFGNVYYEICNEPNTTTEPSGVQWHDHWVEVILSEEASLPCQHMIAVNYDRPYALQHIHPGVSICNVHYTWGDGWVGGMELLDNFYGQPRALALDETVGFPADVNRVQARLEAWEAIVGGCAVYDHLSWAFTPKNAQGDGDEHQAFLRQLQVLREFMESFDYSRMSADKSILAKGFYENVHVRSLVEYGEQYALYIHHGQRSRLEADTCYLTQEGEHASEIGLWIPQGRYSVEWIEPETGNILDRKIVEHASPMLELSSLPYRIDIALRILKKS